MRPIPAFTRECGKEKDKKNGASQEAPQGEKILRLQR